MVDLDTLKQLQQAPLEERIKLIELLLQSVKKELKKDSKIHHTFRVRSFSLGSDINVNREELYNERNHENICD